MSVSVNSVSKLYGSQKALDSVSISINPGEVVGFLGPNGAGKSTMMKIITGYLKPTEGSVSVCGYDVAEQASEVQKLIGYLPEHNPLYPDMYVREYLEMVAGIYRINNGASRIREVIGRTGLTPESHKKIGSLSKGYRQRVGLAQALLPDPQVLILDEPTTGFDPNQIIEVRELIKSVGEEKTVMLSTHIMQEVEAICQRIIIINKGVIAANGNSSDIMFSMRNQSVVEVQFMQPLDYEILKQLPGVTNVEIAGKSHFYVTSTGDTDIRADIFRLAIDKNLTLLTLHRKENQLEDVFHKLTMPH